MNSEITLRGLLSVIDNTQPITVNLYGPDDLLLITFNLPGYPCLEDELEEREVTSLKINSLKNIDVKVAAAP